MDATANWRDLSIEQRFELLFSQLSPTDMDALVDVIERRLAERVHNGGELMQAIGAQVQGQQLRTPHLGGLRRGH